ncbi:hypothetical protein LZK82_26665 (plasmid) [Rhizobium leguminosarum]|uniref:nitrilase-related carbon-nitrogen hydrolase n=1 Tax=Rhizobium leguminosarum TaxID=384 RepID=UPI0004895077|nr:nitrilase-related carbon-nitrogen hydrolase [Rhizobium leguminosarum]UIK01139.1 hypothetical protein LZK82_26665 [Rhizobium leguminosarum]WFT89456.1 nitrilase-related carbon-nitrogen hydrolase [Rhizobium leguminosarum]
MIATVRGAASDGAALHILYRERMPVPVRCGDRGDGSRRAVAPPGDFFANPVVSSSTSRAAPLICYEQLIVWPVLQSMLHDPDFIIAVGNGWWTEGGIAKLFDRRFSGIERG